MLYSFAALWGEENEIDDLVVYDETIFDGSEDGVKREDIAIKNIFEVTRYPHWIWTPTGQDGEEIIVPDRIGIAEIGGWYNKERDTFVPKKPWDSWIFNEERNLWIPPVKYPGDERNHYDWDEEAYQKGDMTGCWMYDEIPEYLDPTDPTLIPPKSVNYIYFN